MATVTILSSSLSPSSKTVRCKNVAVGFKRDIVAEPYANGGTMAKVQTQSQENIRYSLQGIHVAGSGESSTILSYADVLTLSKLDFTGANAPKLIVVYGTASSLVGYDGATTSIPVVVESFNFVLDAGDSLNGYRPSLNMNLVETG